MAKSGQRFIKENRAPRVHIEYEVETFGSRQKIELPFVMGVMSDLSGKSEVEKKSMNDRDFVEFDMDNFEERMSAIKPRAAFVVDNTLTGEGKMGVDLTFNKMDDFTPGEIAKQVPALKKLLDARQELNDLSVYMDGKDGAQGLLEKLMADPDLLKSVIKAEAASEASGDAAAEGDKE